MTGWLESFKHAAETLDSPSPTILPLPAVSFPRGLIDKLKFLLLSCTSATNQLGVKEEKALLSAGSLSKRAAYAFPLQTAPTGGSVRPRGKAWMTEHTA